MTATVFCRYKRGRVLRFLFAPIKHGAITKEKRSCCFCCCCLDGSRWFSPLHYSIVLFLFLFFQIFSASLKPLFRFLLLFVFCLSSSSLCIGPLCFYLLKNRMQRTHINTGELVRPTCAWTYSDFFAAILSICLYFPFKWFSLEREFESCRFLKITTRLSIVDDSFERERKNYSTKQPNCAFTKNTRKQLEKWGLETFLSVSLMGLRSTATTTPDRRGGAISREFICASLVRERIIYSLVSSVTASLFRILSFGAWNWRWASTVTSPALLLH